MTYNYNIHIGDGRLKMTVRPTEEMYGQRVGVIVNSQVLPGYTSGTHVDLCLEGVLSLEGCRRRNLGGEPTYDHVPHQIILEEVTCPNIHHDSHHPLKNGVQKIYLDNAKVIGMYIPNEADKPNETGGGDQPE